jgi:hypothetical protein
MFSLSSNPKNNQPSPSQFDSKAHPAITQLRLLGRDEDNPWSILKIDNNQIYAYNISSDELIKLRQPDKETKRWIAAKPYSNGLRELTALAEGGKELFIIPNYIPFSKHDGCVITKEGVRHANSLFAEIDDCPIEQQWERLRELEESLGLKSSLVVFSGGKSLHVYFKLSRPLTDRSRWESLQQKLIFALRSDIAIANFNREMRLAGFLRKAKGKYQEITHIDENVEYSLSEIESKLDGLDPKFTPERYDFFKFLQTYERQRKHHFNVSTAVAYTVADNEIKDEKRRYQLYCKDVRDGVPNPEKWLTFDFASIRKESKRRKQEREKREASYTVATRNTTGYNNIYAYFAATHAKDWFFEAKPRNDGFVRFQCPMHNDHPNHDHGKDSVVISRDGDTLYCAGCADHQGIRDWLRKKARDNGDPRAEEKFKGNEPEFVFSQKIKLNYSWEKTYTPDHSFSAKWMEDAFDSGLIPYAEKELILSVKAGLGRGKTRMMKGVVEELSSEGWLLIGHRNPLLKQTCRDLGFSHHHDIEKNNTVLDANAILSDPKSKIGITYDSMHKVPLEALEGRNILLDETTAGLAHMLCAGTDIKSHHQESLDYFREVINRADRVFCLDGLMTDSAIDYLAKVDPYKKVIKLENTYQHPLEFTNLIGSIKEVGEKTKIKKHDSSHLLAQIQDHISQSATPVVVADSKKLLLAIDELLSSQGKKGVCITGDSDHDDPLFNQFMVDPNGYLVKYRPDYLLFNSSCQDGLDINLEGYFTAQYALFCGVVSADSAYQMQLRVRDNSIPRYFWAAEFATNSLERPSTFAVTNLARKRQSLLTDLTNSFGKGNFEELKALVDKFDESDPNAKHWAHLQAIRGYEVRNYRQSLVDLLEKSGHKVIDFTGGESAEIKESLKEAKEAVIERYCEIIKTAKAITHDEVEDYRKKQNLKSQLTLKKYYLRQQLPGIDSIFAENKNPEIEVLPIGLELETPAEKVSLLDLEIKRLVFTEPKLLSNLRNQWMFNNLEDAKVVQQQQWGGLQEGDTSVFHLRTNLSKVIALKRALEASGINLDPENATLYTNDSKEVKAFKVECGKAYWADAWGTKPSKKNYPMRWLAQHLEFIGYGLRARKKVEGIRHYQIDFSSQKATSSTWILGQLLGHGMALKLWWISEGNKPENEQKTRPEFFLEKTLETTQWRYFQARTDHPPFTIYNEGRSVPRKNRGKTAKKPPDFYPDPAPSFVPLSPLEEYLAWSRLGEVICEVDLAMGCGISTVEARQLLNDHPSVVLNEWKEFIHEPYCELSN